MTVESQPVNPFVGLRPFEIQESDLFFGREEQTVALLQCLHHNKFVAVVGSSGSGKSSLVRAGLIPKLEGGFLLADRPHWHVATMKPGHALLNNLVEALLAVPTGHFDPQDVDALREKIEEGGPRAVLDMLAPLLKDTDANLLLLIDQFEEIFRFGGPSTHGTQHDEAADFVSIMLALANQRELPVYVVMTMRSDFLGDCDVFYGLPEALNRSQYLVPRLTRRQLRTAIVGPIRLLGGEITPALVDVLLNDAGKERDRLPVIQHALLRTWDYAQNNGKRALDCAHYEAAGTLDKALSQHADEALHGMSEDQRRITETLFRTLTVTDAGNRHIRRPARRSEIEKTTGASREEINEIVKRFQKDRRSFLVMPDEKDSFTDISHESLIRQWDTLRGWVDEEATSARMYRRLADRTIEYEAGRGSLLRDPQLQLVLDWHAEDHPTATWARRYDPDPENKPRYDKAMGFLKESQKKREKTRILRIVLFFSMVALTVLAIGAAGFALVKSKEAKEQASIADSRRLASLSFNFFLDKNLAPALLLSVEANRTTSTVEARSSLAKALDYSALVHTFLHGHQSAVSSVAFSPDSSQLASGSDDGTIILWDVPSGNALDTLRGHRHTVGSVAFSPDGRRLASGSDDRTIILWDVPSGDTLGTLHGHRRKVRSVAFSPDGRRLASGSYDGTIILWDADAHTLLHQFKEYRSPVSSVAFSPDGAQLASGHTDGRVILWNVESGEITTRLNEHTLAVSSVAFSPDGAQLASGSDDGTIILWDVKSDERRLTLRRHQGSVKSVAFSPDGAQLASGSDDGTIILWDVPSGDTLSTLHGPQRIVRSVAFSPDGLQLASVGNLDTIILWNVEPAEITQRLEGHHAAVWGAAFSPDGSQLASGSDDGTIILWDLPSGDTLSTLRGHWHKVRSVAFSPDGRRLASGSDEGMVILWDLPSGDTLSTFRGHRGRVRSVAFSPDGRRLASGSYDRTIILWDVESGDTLSTLHGHRRNVRSVAFSPDGAQLASGSDDGTIILWDLQSGDTLRTLQGHPGRVLNVAFSPDGLQLASSGDLDTIILWDVHSGEKITTLSGNQDIKVLFQVYGVAFSPDGKLLASGSSNKTITLWDVPSGEKITTLRGHPKRVLNVTFSPDGRRLASSSEDQTIILWDVQTDLDRRLAKACQIAHRNLSWEEWQKFLENESYRRTCEELPIHPSFLQAAEELAIAGDIKEAVAIFRQVLELDPHENFHPEDRAKLSAAEGKLEKGKKLAAWGDVEGATAIFQEVIKLGTRPGFDPETEAKKLAAPGLILKGKRLTRSRKIDEAIAAFEEAQEFDPTLEVSSDSWNEICWIGSLWDYRTDDVMEACEKAVALAPGNGSARDSRGLARALKGIYKGAIEDFQYYVEWGQGRRPKERLLKRRAWIRKLQAGLNPFDAATLKALRTE